MLALRDADSKLVRGDSMYDYELIIPQKHNPTSEPVP